MMTETTQKETKRKRFNIIVGQSGGPTAVINSSLYGVIAEGLAHPEEISHVYGMVHGIEGFLQGEIMDLGAYFAENGPLEDLKTTPAAFLGSCRFKLPEAPDAAGREGTGGSAAANGENAETKAKEAESAALYQTLFARLEALEIGAFFYIGGNDSMDTVGKLSAYARAIGSEIRFIGIPKTIDNDLVETDHTPGYGSAAKYIAATVQDIAMDAGVYKQSVVTIVEIMGRHAGWLTAASALARTEQQKNPLLIYLPEMPFDVDIFLRQLRAALMHTHSVVVCVSEGILDEKGKLICEYGGESGVDGFGHKMLAGSGKVLERIVRERFGIKCRSIELNLPQRCSAVLASAADVSEAAEAGCAGVREALAGATGVMICMERSGGSRAYEISYVPKDVAGICNLEKKFPAEWITHDGTDVSEAFLRYVRPLIEGEVQVPFRNGLPSYVRRRETK